MVAFAAWLDHAEDDGDDEASSVAAYVALQRRLPRSFLDKRVIAVTPRNVAGVLERVSIDGEPHDPIDSELLPSMLRHAFDLAVRWEIITRSPCATIELSGTGAGSEN